MVGALIRRRVDPVLLASHVPCEPEITHLQFVSLGIDEQVLWLDITMHHVLTMKVLDGLE